MTDGVARELEQAEARLAEARDGLAEARGLLRRGVVLDALELRALEVATGAYEDAAIEVGRLRALAEMPNGPAYWSGSSWLTRYEGQHPDGRWVALAAREEVQG